MGNYLRQDFSGGWQPSFDAFNAPKNALLRADNLMCDERGALALRQGSAKLHSSALADTDVHSIFTTRVNRTKTLMLGCGNSVYVGTSRIATGLSGTGDIAFGAHLGQVLFARGTSKSKYDGTTVRNWGIAPPAAAPTLSVLPPDSKTFATCDSSELPVMTSNEGTQTFAVDRFGISNKAVQIAPDATTGRGMSTKTFTSPQDFTSYDLGTTATDDDLIDFYAYYTEPQYISGVTLLVDVNDGTFQNDWYEYTFSQGESIEVVNGPQDSLASIYTVEGPDRQRVLAELGQTVSTTTVDSNVTTIVGWNHFQVPRGRMVPHVQTPGKNWGTVFAVRVIVLATVGGSGSAVRFDDIRITGAGLTGRYTVRMVATRDNGTYVALSGPTDISNEIKAVSQQLTGTLDADSVAALDTQVTAVRLYVMGGRLNSFYLAASSEPSAGSGAFDYTAPWETAYFQTLNGIANYTSQFEVSYGGTIGPKSHNYSWESVYLTIPDPLTITADLSEVQMLIQDEVLETDNTVPPDDIVMIEGPHFDRTLVLTEEFLYPSRELDPDAYSQGQVVRVGDSTETALWIKKINDSNVYVGTTRDIYRLDGDWTPQPDGSINVIKREMHVSNPPISSAVATGKVNGVDALIYLAGDGWNVLGLGTLTNNAVDLLWRGFTRHDVFPVNLTDPDARFRVAVTKNVLFTITPEAPDTTSSTVLHVYHFTHKQWYRFVYPQAFRSIYADPDGTLIAGDELGFLRQLDLATKQDDGVDIAIDLRTPIDDNDQPFTYKDPENFWMQCDTADDTATVAFHINGAGVASATTTTAQEQTGTANQDMSACPEFTELQLRISGSFSTFVLRQWGLRYIDNPLPQVIHDTGPIDLTADALKWVRRLKIKAKSPVDLTVQPYWDGVAGTTRTITVNEDVTEVYVVPLGRQDYGRVGRIVITSTEPSHVYWIRFDFNGTGNQNQKVVSLQPEAA